MPKTKISEYSATNSANTDIEGINIDEGCAPSGINNAIRELMVHLKEFQTGASGDAFTFAGGTLMSGTNTISGAAIISGNINSSGTNTFSGSNFMSFSGGSSASPSIYFASDTNTGIFSPAADTIAFTEGGAESMRIDSSGNVVIGSATSNGKLTLKNPSSGSEQVMLAIQAASSTSALGRITYDQTVDTLRFTNMSSFSGSSIRFGNNGLDQVMIDLSGNVGIGTTSPGTSNTAGASFVPGTSTVASMTGSNGSGQLLLGNNGNGSNLAANDNCGAIIFKGRFNGTFGGGNDVASILGTYTGNGTTRSGAIRFLTLDNGTEAERARIDSSGNVGIGTTSLTGKFTVRQSSDATNGGIVIEDTSGGGAVISRLTDGGLTFRNGGLERARITSGGIFLVGKTATGIGTVGSELGQGGDALFTASGSALIYCNRLASDGNLVEFRQDGVTEGTISVSGTTVSYNGGHLSRWAQMPGTKDDTIVKGTVMSNLDEMNVYTDAEGNPVDNEQLNKVKVSDVEGDVNVAGVFVNWTYDDAHQVDEINMAMTGDMIIRIAQGVVVQKGDLLMSAGDGTAKPQGDDIVRSKTVAKVTSNHVTCTYADGSYCVPCVLMAC